MLAPGGRGPDQGAGAAIDRDRDGVPGVAGTRGDEGVICREAVISNALGLHARAAARFVQLASRFKSRIQIANGGRTADGKSILGLLALIRSEAGEPYARVFEAQILILKDRTLLQETAGVIRRERVNAEWAFHTVVGRYTQVFSQLGDQALRDRGTDIEDVAARVQAILTGSKRRHDLSELTE